MKAGVVQSQSGKPQARVTPNRHGVLSGGARGGVARSSKGGPSNNLANLHSGARTQPSNTSQPAKVRTRGTSVGGMGVTAPG